MKVLHIIWNANFGGIEKLVYDLAIAQDKLVETEVHIFIVKEEGEFLDRFKATGLQIFFSKLKTGFDLNLKEYIKSRLLFKKYDVIHFHIFNPLLSLFSVGLKSKIVFTEHGNFGYGRKKKRTDNAMNFAKKLFLKYFTSWITYNSNFTKKNTENSYNLYRQKNTSVVYNGIQLSVMDEKNTSRDLEDLTLRLKDKFVIGTSSRFVSFKRIDRLIRAFSKIKNIEGCILLLVGDGVLLSELKQQVEDLDISQFVVFTGYQNHVRDFQRLMDVCVFPSQSESFGLVAIESLSLNKPTIVFSDGGGIKEIIENISKNDVVNNEFELTARLNDYINHVGNLNDSSRINYAKEFSIEIASQKFNDIYRGLLQS